MNQSTPNRKSIFRELLLAALFSAFSFSILFVLLAYAFFQIPGYENYYAFFSPILLALEGGVLVLFCRRFYASSLLIALFSSAFISLFSILSGILFYKASFDLSVFATHVVFVVTTVIAEFLVLKKKPRVKRSARLPFQK